METVAKLLFGDIEYSVVKIERRSNQTRLLWLSEPLRTRDTRDKFATFTVGTSKEPVLLWERDDKLNTVVVAFVY